ncbi:MAG: 1-acyl-sn-glycerol-3-phosphate acyltransferase [Parachlamydiales bacterium]|nr:1-acyl-sn-glycerol-3-phosphate acyltransferase [Parachlamydiales bacterium]
MTMIFRFGRALFRMYFRIFYKNQVYLPKDFFHGGAILAANHTSYFDPPLVGVACPDDIHFLARESLFKHPVFGYLIRKAHAHPVAGGGSDLNSIKLICKLLKEGKKVLIFPEGTRTPDGQLAPFKGGIAFIALRSNVPIIPVYVYGTYDAWGRQRKAPKLFGKVAVVFGSAIDLNEYSQMDRKEAQEKVAQRLYQAILDLKQWYDNGAQGFPP